MDSEEGDSSLLLKNVDVVQVSGQPPLFVDINMPVNMTDASLAYDGVGKPPAAPATDFASKDGWLESSPVLQRKTHSSGGALSNYIKISRSSPIEERWRSSL